MRDTMNEKSQSILIFPQTKTERRVLNPPLYTSKDPRIECLPDAHKRFGLSPGSLSAIGIDWKGSTDLVPQSSEEPVRSPTPITIHMPQKWISSSRVMCIFCKTRANCILVKQCNVFIVKFDAQ